MRQRERKYLECQLGVLLFDLFSAWVWGKDDQVGFFIFHSSEAITDIDDSLDESTSLHLPA